jgi:hypothetical protein
MFWSTNSPEGKECQDLQKRKSARGGSTIPSFLWSAGQLKLQMQAKCPGVLDFTPHFRTRGLPVVSSVASMALRLFDYERMATL